MGSWDARSDPEGKRGVRNLLDRPVWTCPVCPCLCAISSRSSTFDLVNRKRFSGVGDACRASPGWSARNGQMEGTWTTWNVKTELLLNFYLRKRCRCVTPVTEECFFLMEGKHRGSSFQHPRAGGLCPGAPAPIRAPARLRRLLGLDKSELTVHKDRKFCRAFLLAGL